MLIHSPLVKACTLLRYELCAAPLLRHEEGKLSVLHLEQKKENLRK